MPVLLWVAFWSSLMGTAACWAEARGPIRVAARETSDEKRDLSSGD